MHFGDDEKPGRKAALKTLMDMVGKHTSDKLSSIKKPGMAAAEATDDEVEMPEADEEAGDGEISDEEKAKIEELYNRYCKN